MTFEHLTSFLFVLPTYCPRLIYQSKRVLLGTIPSSAIVSQANNWKVEQFVWNHEIEKSGSYKGYIIHYTVLLK